MQRHGMKNVPSVRHTASPIHLSFHWYLLCACVFVFCMFCIYPVTGLLPQKAVPSIIYSAGVVSLQGL